jgi:hypothetical protein
MTIKEHWLQVGQTLLSRGMLVVFFPLDSGSEVVCLRQTEAGKFKPGDWLVCRCPEASENHAAIAANPPVFWMLGSSPTMTN